MNSIDTDYLFGTVATVTGTAVGLTLDSHLRQGQSILENLTVVKMQRAALYAIASLAPYITAVVSQQKAAVLLSLVGSALCVFKASQLRDYDDAKELQIMKNAAAGMSFRELTKTHTLNNLINYQIVEDLPAKFALSYTNTPFSSIVMEYPLEKIAQYLLAPLTTTGFLHAKFVHELSARRWEFLRERNLSNPLYTNLLSTEMYTNLVSLQNDLGNIDKVYDRRLTELNIQYSERTEAQLKKFAERERNIPYLAKKMSDQVASSASGNALSNALFNAVWDGNTNHIIRDAGNGLNVAEAAGKYAELAELERLSAELRKDRENPILIARGAAEQKDYDIGVAQARLDREAQLAQFENALTEILLKN